MREEGTQTVQSVKRAFILLRLIAKHPEGISLSDLSEQSGLAKTTTLRLLNTLEILEAVERLANDKGYRIGEGISRLSSALPFHDQLVTMARPYLQTLNEQTGETVNICIADGHEALYLDQINSDYHIQIQDWTGFRCPMHVASGGKVLLAYASKEKISRYLTQPLARFTEKTISNPKRLEEDLVIIRSRGYSITEDEFEPEMIALGAPVKDSSGRVIAALCLGGPRYRLNLKDKTLKAQLITAVTRQAAQLSQQLSGIKANAA